MNAYLQQLQKQFLAIWGMLSARQKAAYLLVVLVFLSGLGGIVAWSTRPQWEPLYANLDPADAAKIKAELDRAGVAYKLEGNQILVARAQIPGVRLDLSNRGAQPRGGLAGFEILDAGLGSLTQTTEEKKRAYQRALAGEIARSLKVLDGVADADVKITIPEERVYQEDREPVTASVILTLANNDIKTEQVEEIIKFVAGAVPGLKRESISVTNQRMEPLTPVSDEEGGLVLAKKRQLDLERAIVKGYENGLKSALAQILGGGDKVTVRVNVAMDFDRVEKDITNLTKPGFEQLLTSQQTLTERFTGLGFRPGGAAGVESNIPGLEAVQNQQTNYERNEVRTNYEHNTEHTLRTQSPYIKRLTAMVNVDGSYKIERDPLGNITTRTYVPRTPEELAQIEQQVKNALGFDATRGDNITVSNISIDRSDQFAEEEAQRRKEAEQKRIMMMTFAGTVIAILLLLLLLELQTYLNLRDQKAMRERELAKRSTMSLIAEKGMITELSIEEKEKLELRRRAEKAAKEQPEMVANLVRTWLAED